VYLLWSTKYRNIYKKHYGAIPNDSDGRTYDIHHIDGNHSNNAPENLKAVTIQEHYDIHYSCGDWAACLRLSARINLNPARISELARKNSLERVANGTHNFLGGEIQRESTRRYVAEGIHNFCRRSDGTSLTLDRVVDGTNPFLGPENNRKRIEDGSHHFLRSNLSEVTCPYCGKIGKQNMKRYHFDNCVENPKSTRQKVTSHQRGKTYEELYGIEKALKLKKAKQGRPKTST